MFLPFYRDTNATGDHSEALSQSEIVHAFSEIFDAWMRAPNAVVVNPLHQLVDVARRAITDTPRAVYDKAAREFVYVVKPSGDLWGISEVEDNRFLYGNVFEDDLGIILNGEARRATYAAASERISRVCRSCPYLGHCSGYFVADATDGVLGTIEREGCHIRGVLDHIMAGYEETGIAADIRLAYETAPST